MWTRGTSTRGPPSRVSRYGVAISSVALASLVTLSLKHPEIRGPLFIPAILVSAWYGGAGPGVLAVILSILGIHYLSAAPRFPLRFVRLDDAVYLLVFSLSALLVAWMAATQRRIAEALRQAHDELSGRMRDLGRANERLQAEVGERERVEAEVYKQASLLDLTHDSVFVRDVDDVITYWSRGAAERYGWSGEEAVGKVCHQLTRTIFPAPFGEIEAELHRTGRWEGELVHTRRDGTQVVVASRWSLRRDEQGRPVGVLETNNDITERKRAEEALEQRERRFRALIERSSDGVVLYTADGTIVYASPAVERILHYTPEELVGRRAFDFVHPEHREARVKRHDGIMSEPDEPFVAETLVRRKDGALRWIESTVTNLLHEPSVQAVVSNFRDVTERKQAEYLTSQVFECSPDSVAIVGTDYRFKRVNPTVERRYGLPAEQIVGMHVADIVGVDVFEQTIKPRLDRCFAGEDVSFSTWLTNVVPGRRFYAVSYSPLRPDSERVEAALATTRDLTEHLRASEALQEAQAELARVTRVTMLGEITASLAHEVNQPLAAVVMNGNACRRWLAADPPNIDEASRAAQRIVSDGERAGQVIGRIRALVRRATPEKSALEINEAIRETLTFTRGELERHAVSLRTELREDLPPVVGDRVQLQQLLMNLVLNGIDAMAGITGWPRVLTIGSRLEDPDRVLVEVKDCGEGLGAGQQDRIFDAFYSTKAGGLGMGLSISRSIVEAHGGRIWATPNDGAGVTMRFTLPAAPGGA